MARTNLGKLSSDHYTMVRDRARLSNETSPWLLRKSVHLSFCVLSCVLSFLLLACISIWPPRRTHQKTTRLQKFAPRLSGSNQSAMLWTQRMTVRIACEMCSWKWFEFGKLYGVFSTGQTFDAGRNLRTMDGRSSQHDFQTQMNCRRRLTIFRTSAKGKIDVALKSLMRSHTAQTWQVVDCYRWLPENRKGPT